MSYADPRYFLEDAKNLSDLGSVPTALVNLGLSPSSSVTFGNLNLATGGGLRTNTLAGNTLLLQAYDVDGAAYVTFATLTANNTPTFDLAVGTTIGGSPIGTGSGNVTAASNITDNALVRGDGGLKGIQQSGIIIDDTDNMSAIASLQLLTGGALRTSTGAGNTVLLQAYDTDTGPAYVTFITLTAGTAPTCLIRPHDGTAGAPPYSFNSETNMGFFRASANNMGWSTLGAQFLTLNNTAFQSANSTQWYLAYSTGATTPTYSFVGDTNNGWYRSAADEQSWSTAGVQRMVLTQTTHDLLVPITVTTSGLTALTLTSTDAGATAGPIVDCYRNSASPAAADILSQHIFNGMDSGAAKQEYARYEARIISTTAAAEKGAWALYTMNSGTATKQFDALDTGCQVRGNNTNTAAPAGFIGEIIESVIASGSAASISTGVAQNVTSLSLTAGNWLIHGNVGFTTGGALTGTQTAVSISATSATTTEPSYTATPTMPTANSVQVNVAPVLNVSLASTTTYYLVGSAAFTVGTMSVYGKITAQRIG